MPMPVFAFTSTSSNFFASAFSLETSVPIIAAKNPSGIEMMPGLVSVMRGSPTKMAAPASGDQTFGLIATRIRELSKPTSIPVTAPVVLNRFQKIVNKMIGKFALAATAKASATKRLRSYFEQIMQE